ncbi:MAG TPA: CorA family divalent cation transporter, partial [Acetobacteraceae bacterium]
MLTSHPQSPTAKATPWIDLLNPEPDEAELVASTTGLHVPSHAELREIETSSRMSQKDGALYLSLPAVRRLEGGGTRVTPVGFVLTPERLLTVRFDALPVFETYTAACAAERKTQSSLDLFLGLMEAM